MYTYIYLKFNKEVIQMTPRWMTLWHFRDLRAKVAFSDIVATGGIVFSEKRLVFIKFYLIF